MPHTTFHTPTLSHTIFDTPLCHTPPFIHHLSHITLSHTIFHTIFHTPLCHIPSLTHRFVTHHFVTHHLPHTTLSHAIFHTRSQAIFHNLSHTVTDHLSHTIFHTTLCLTPSFTAPSFTHHFVTHHLSPHHLSRTTLSHTIFRHTIFNTQLCHTPSFAKPSFTHHFVTHHLSHTTLSHALFHTQLSHTPSFTHHFVTHTIFLSHTPAFTYNFVTHNFVLLLHPPPPPLSFLPSPSPLQHLVLIIERSCLVGLSGPLICFCSFFGRVENDMAMRTAFKRQTLGSMQQMLGQHRSDFSFKVILWCCVVFSVLFGLGPVLAHGWHRPWETEPSLQSCRRFVDNFCKLRPETAETETLLLRQLRKPLYPKKRRVSRPTVFSSLNSRVPDLLHFPTMTC